MANLTEQLILSVCLKCQASSIIDTLRKWGRLNEEQLQFLLLVQKKARTKQNMARSILDLVHDQEEVEMSTDIAGDLELSYIQLHPKKKMWKVFKLSGGAIDFQRDPRTLRLKLIRELQAKWKDGIIYGNMSYYSGAIWLRIHFDTSKRRRRKKQVPKSDYDPKNSMFILYYQGSPNLIMSHFRVKETTLLTKALTEVFNANSLNYMRLSDRNVFSLSDITLKKHHKAPQVDRFLELGDKENPLSHNDRKRKAKEDIFQDLTDTNIVDENMVEKRQRRLVVDKKFGVGPQPALEKLEYKFSIGFHSGQKSFRKPQNDCKTHVDIKGSSVLSGLTQLAQKGFMTFPLPRHITGVIEDQRNSFTVVSSKSKG